ncbi:Spc98 family-domain-containing protein, partial [Hygrophoropsis aurantiaca]
MTSQNPPIQSYLDQIKLIISNHEACIRIDDKVTIPLRYAGGVASQFSDQNPELTASVLSKSLDDFLSSVVPPPQLGVLDPDNFLRLCVQILRQREAGTIPDGIEHGTEVADRENREDVIQADDGDDTIQVSVSETGHTRALEEIAQLRKMCDEITEKQEQLQLKTDSVSLALHGLGRDLSARTSEWDEARISLAESVDKGMSELQQGQKYIHKNQEALARSQENNVVAIAHVEDAFKELLSTVDDHKASTSESISRKAAILRGLCRMVGCYFVRQQLCNDSMRKQLEKLQGTVHVIQRFQLSHVDSFSDVRTDLQFIRTLLGELEGSRNHNDADLVSIKTTLDVVVEEVADIRASLNEAVARLQTPVLTLANELQQDDAWRREQGIASGVPIAQMLSKLRSTFLAVVSGLSLLIKLNLRGHRLNHIWAAVALTTVRRRLPKFHLRGHRRNHMIHMWAAVIPDLQICVQSYQMPIAEMSAYLALANPDQEIRRSYTDTGDPFVRKFTDQLLEEVSKPFFSTLHKWLFSGELYDPYNEFFVSVDPELVHMQYMLHPSSLAGGISQLSTDGVFAGLGGENEDLSTEREGGLRLWEAKYQFQREMLPLFVGEAFGKKIFSTGKSLNFIRYSCHDSDWVATREKMSNTGGILKYSDIAGLERSIDSAYVTASQRLFEVFIEKFKLLDHLSALKHYLMLSHGDFAEQLMEALGQ